MYVVELVRSTVVRCNESCSTFVVTIFLKSSWLVEKLKLIEAKN